jgi:excinuclease ABC subunit B
VRDKLLRQLTDIQYQRNDIDFHRNTFRVRGDVVDIFPAVKKRLTEWSFLVMNWSKLRALIRSREKLRPSLQDYTVFPGSHYVTPHEKLKNAMAKIREEADERKAWFESNNKLLEAQRLEQRVKFDLKCWNKRDL